MPKAEVVVWGFDPGNASSGVAAFFRNELVWHSTIEPHRAMWWGFDFEYPENARHVVYCEVPQNGTHTSRGGVNWAGGMLLSTLSHNLGLNVSRRNIRKVKPSQWRKWSGLPTKHVDEDGLKTLAIEAVKERFDAEVESDDEAEAILIAAIGYVRETECFK